MTKVMKKLVCVLMAIMMVAVMMPAMAFAAEGGASTQADLKVFVNGVDTGKIVSAAYLLNEKNWEPAQVFSMVQSGKKGSSFSYVVAQGPSMEAVLKKAGVIKSSLKEIQKGSVEIWDTPETKQSANGYALAIADLMKATSVVKLDQDINADDVTMSKQAGATPVVPVYAVKSASADTYEAATALDFSKAKACSMPVVGNNAKGDMVVKKGGASNMDSANINAKYQWKNGSVLNVVTAPAKPSGLKVKKSGKTAKVTWKAVKGAAKYQVAYKKGNGKWTVVDTAKNSLKVTKLTKGKTYSFKVRAANTNCHGDNIAGSYSAVKKVK